MQIRARLNLQFKYLTRLSTAYKTGTRHNKNNYSNKFNYNLLPKLKRPAAITPLRPFKCSMHQNIDSHSFEPRTDTHVKRYIFGQTYKSVVPFLWLRIQGNAEKKMLYTAYIRPRKIIKRLHKMENYSGKAIDPVN